MALALFRKDEISPLPDIEPEVSRTKTTSFGIFFFVPESNPGDANSMK